MEALSPRPLVLLILLFTTTTLLSIAFYRLFLSPLSHIPGPPLWCISRLPFAYHVCLGRITYAIASLHDKYGPVVRVAPDEISFTTPEAWNDIYGMVKSKDGEKIQMRKDPDLFFRPSEGSKDMTFELDDVEHARQRRVFSHAFSDKSLRDQEPIIESYINKMSDRLHEVCGKPVNMSAWFNYVLFDTSGDLVLGDSFGCLENGALHPWINSLFSVTKGITLMGMTQRFWPLTPILMFFVPKKVRNMENEHRALIKERLEKRFSKTTPRQDIITAIAPFLNASGQNSITTTELYHNTSILVPAGSETSATTLTGLLYYLLSNPQSLCLLKDEIRSAFSNASDITIESVTSLTFQNAAISEAFRLFTPLPGSMRRISPPGGSTISGIYIPGNTIVAVDSYAASHSSSNFHNPEAFIPERWLAPEDMATFHLDEEIWVDFKDDKKSVVQPFSKGSRNCIGQRLAMAQIRLIVARLMWEFDFELEESRGWVDGIKVYTMYERPPLMCRLTPLRRRE
ncbi:cytochrome P450 [Cadophora sp. MPI-SDFR-AT-0126]|nr:cytochrome P450 [Leotiomycetes sp. MPI-SDFR-AT-0126]